MKTALYTFSALVLISAGVVFTHCGMLWSRNITEIEQNPELSIVEKFQKTVNNRENNNRQAVSPLVQQAQNFAVYINPPPPPKPSRSMQIPAPGTNSESYDHDCWPDCEYGGDFCQWTFPPIQSGCIEEDPEDKQCTVYTQDKVCDWIVTDTILLTNASCVEGYEDCTRIASPCVRIKPVLCDDELPALICHCCHHETYGHYGQSVFRGSGLKCPELY